MQCGGRQQASSEGASIADEQTMENLGECWAKVLRAPQLWRFEGPLGAGKTTLIRGMLRGLGHQGPVRSPTFSLVECYAFEAFELYHFDLYRLSQPEELEGIGFRDYFHPRSVCLIEWPEKGGRYVGLGDYQVMIDYQQQQRKVLLKAR